MDIKVLESLNEIIDNAKPIVFSNIMINITLEYYGFKLQKDDNGVYYKYEFKDKRDNGCCVLIIDEFDLKLYKYLTNNIELIETSELLDSVKLGISHDYSVEQVFLTINEALNYIKVNKDMIDDYNILSSIARRLPIGTIKLAVDNDQLEDLDVNLKDGIYGIDQPLPEGVEKIGETNDINAILNILGDI